MIIHYSNVAYLKIRYFAIDLKFASLDKFKSISPKRQQSLKLDPKINDISVPIEPEYRGQTCLIELFDPSTQASCTVKHVNCDLLTNVYSEIGNIEVRDARNDRLVAGVYVKTFVKQRDSTIEFYKDGYTDISGRFDYASISVDKLKNAEEFSIFISHEKLGFKILKASPPLNI
eukprot:CAMPEP_0114578018 /NCGR_PEP_ID=MMETSP0125-20121206/2609_1 /TAXON_ID=485358 ORGANISM="Aristerostoma sp., Strain ATCC 50986" /NCGR_SAMPLE_ID=MMETSP0125 /ASSEMBLY_ACC=CAM_ASM_000245 /LENGTH=173 /DNA_ID=CAMNT_0001767771 /DNA_START=680 /DNA_END=1202 /DNA_ORIENTATION=-